MQTYLLTEQLIFSWASGLSAKPAIFKKNDSLGILRGVLSKEYDISEKRVIPHLHQIFNVSFYVGCRKLFEQSCFRNIKLTVLLLLL